MYLSEGKKQWSQRISSHTIYVLHEVLIPDDWVRSHDLFHSASFFFPLSDLMTYEMLHGVKGYSSISIRSELGDGERWTDEGRWACPQDGLAGRMETESDRNSGECKPARGEESNREQKRREPSQRILPRSRMWIKVKASQKAHSLWKHRRLQKQRVWSLLCEYWQKSWGALFSLLFILC